MLCLRNESRGEDKTVLDLLEFICAWPNNQL
jgi:hypothetical protein